MYSHHEEEVSMVKGKLMVTRCTTLRSTMKKGIGNIYYYLETRSTTVSWN